MTVKLAVGELGRRRSSFCTERVRAHEQADEADDGRAAALLTLPLPASIDSASLGHAEHYMAAPTRPLAAHGDASSHMLASATSSASLPSMFAADLEGQAPPEVQSWEFTFNHLLHRASPLPPLELRMGEGKLHKQLEFLKMVRRPRRAPPRPIIRP